MNPVGHASIWPWRKAPHAGRLSSHRGGLQRDRSAIAGHPKPRLQPDLVLDPGTEGADLHAQPGSGRGQGAHGLDEGK